MLRSEYSATTYDQLRRIGPSSSDAYEVLDNAGRQVHIVKSARVVSPETIDPCREDCAVKHRQPTIRDVPLDLPRGKKGQTASGQLSWVPP